MIKLTEKCANCGKYMKESKEAIRFNDQGKRAHEVCPKPKVKIPSEFFLREGSYSIEEQELNPT